MFPLFFSYATNLALTDDDKIYGTNCFYILFRNVVFKNLSQLTAYLCLCTRRTHPTRTLEQIQQYIPISFYGIMLIQFDLFGRFSLKL